jgi:RNA polymerase sigma factor (TIGR02999 family)
MPDVTRILHAIDQGDRTGASEEERARGRLAAKELLPLVYDELRKLAALKLVREKPGQTLDATALVHEAYLRLVSPEREQGAPNWDNRGHFFAAAAESMRRILVDRAREKARHKRGGKLKRLNIDDVDLATTASPDQLLAIDEALAKLTATDPAAGRLVHLRYFAGLTVEEAAKAIGISMATAYRHWTYARAWLYSELCGEAEKSEE